MLPDPLATLTVDAVDFILARTSSSEDTCVYRTSDGLTKLTVTRQEKSRNRFTVRFDRKKIDSETSEVWTYAAYLVVDVPTDGVTAAEAEDVVQLLTAFTVAGTPDYILRVLQGEI